MRETSAALRVVVLLVLVPLGVLAFAFGHPLLAIGMLAFAGIGFAGLSFSGIDPTGTDRRSRKWFDVGMGFGLIAALVLLIYLGEAILDGDTRTRNKMAAALLTLLPVLWRYRRNILALADRKKASIGPLNKP
jgi:hypothetical protein